jgi:DNA polymerase V
MGVPVFQIRDLVKEHGIEVFSSNYVLYADMSNRVMTLLRQLPPIRKSIALMNPFWS